MAPFFLGDLEWGFSSQSKGQGKASQAKKQAKRGCDLAGRMFWSGEIVVPDAYAVQVVALVNGETVDG